MADVVRFERELLEFLRKERPALLAKLRQEKKFTEAIEEELKKAIVEFKKEFIS